MMTIEDHSNCPECGSTNTRIEYRNCFCCRTYEGNGTTCWQAPVCRECGFEGYANSDGIYWFCNEDQERKHFLGHAESAPAAIAAVDGKGS